MSLSTINSETESSAWPSAIWVRYLKWYLLVLLLVCAVVAAFNAVVDPQARILIVEKAGFNQVKVALETNSRKGKANAVRQCDYDMLVLGTSRAETAISPEHATLVASRPYNAALKAGSMYEIQRLAQYAMRYQEPSSVLLGLDFVAFSSTLSFDDDFPDSPLAEDVPWISLARYLVSLQTLSQSLLTLKWNIRRNVEICFDDGQHKASRERKAARLAFDYILGRYARGPYSQYRPGDAHFEHLAELLKDMLEADVAVYAFISPFHISHRELLTEMNMLDEFENWKRKLVQVFAEANRNTPGRRQAVLWDFSGYNEITTEPVPSPDKQKYMRWFNDSSHVKPSAGNLIIDRVYGLQSAELAAIDQFGIQLSPDNIEAVIENDRLASERYRQENPGEIEHLQEILRFEP